MNTRSLITKIQRNAPDWSRTEILDIVNDVNRIMMSHELMINLVTDTSTGRDPVLTTSDGTYSYEISQANGFPADGLYIVDIYKDVQADPDYGIYQRSRNYNDIRFVRGASSVNAKIIFGFNPGVNDYSVRYYKQPTEITSESISLDVPDEWHELVREGVIAQIQDMEHGKSDAWKRFQEGELPKYWNDMNKDIKYYDYTQTPRGY